MKLRFRIVAKPKLCHMTLEQLQEIAANTVVEFDCNVHPVSFSPVPPVDTSIPWQPVDDCGGAPVGRIKTFKNGEWT